MTCEEVIDEKDENWYQQTAGFLPVDGAATLEVIDTEKTLEIAEMDPFAGLYQMGSDMHDVYTVVEAPEEPEGLRES